MGHEHREHVEEHTYLATSVTPDYESYRLDLTAVICYIQHNTAWSPGGLGHSEARYTENAGRGDPTSTTPELQLFVQKTAQRARMKAVSCRSLAYSPFCRRSPPFRACTETTLTPTSHVFEKHGLFCTRLWPHHLRTSNARRWTRRERSE